MSPDISVTQFKPSFSPPYTDVEIYNWCNITKIFVQFVIIVKIMNFIMQLKQQTYSVVIFEK